MTAVHPRADAWERLRAALADHDADALLVTDPASVRYLSHFTSPDDGVVLVLEDRALLITDGRYTAQAHEESRIDVVIERPWLDAVVARVGRRRLAIEADALTVTAYEQLRAGLDHAPLSTTGMVRRIREVKSPSEIEALRRAAEITDRAFASALSLVRPGVREADVAWHIRSVLHEHDAEPAFDVVVASGTRSAMPHGVASDKRIEDGDLVTIDMGARLHGYHADMTRTIAVGDVGRAARDLHAAVLAAEQRALEQVRAGRTGDALDQVARDILTERGYEDGIVHSLGHGVGLQIHEGPSLRKGSADVLVPGMAVTIEPGAYYPGRFGARIEDLVVVTDDGCEVLSHSPRDLEPTLVS